MSRDIVLMLTLVGLDVVVAAFFRQGLAAHVRGSDPLPAGRKLVTLRDAAD